MFLGAPSTQFLCFLQAQAGDLSDSLDYIDLVGADFLEKDSEFGFLFGRSAPAAAAPPPATITGAAAAAETPRRASSFFTSSAASSSDKATIDSSNCCGLPC